MPLFGVPRGLRAILLPVVFFTITLLTIQSFRNAEDGADLLKNLNGKSRMSGSEEDELRGASSTGFAPPRYKPTPTYAVPAVNDPFPLLASSTATPPQIPRYNVPQPDLHREYGLLYAPPLFIGFTRQWPMLLQCVVSYITAGWPAESIFVVENTGVQRSNSDGKLTLQNPFYFNHTTLQKLGVNVVQTPVLLTFSQLQNFFLSTAHTRNWPYYFYSHQDVLVLSFEDGADPRKRSGDREWFFYDGADEVAVMHPPAAGEDGYRTIYENCLRELNVTIGREERWAFRWFQYDHLTLVNREAVDSVGGWDSLMPYYGSDCDMNARLEMDGWTMRHRRVGIINDVSTVMEDLAALYRVPGVVPDFVDPNPVKEEDMDALENKEDKEKKKEKETSPSDAEKEEKSEPKSSSSGKVEGTGKSGKGQNAGTRRTTSKTEEEPPGHDRKIGGKSSSSPSSSSSLSSSSSSMDYFRDLLRVADDMGAYKYRSENAARNSWQSSQHGGAGEPYAYDPQGFSTSFWILAEAGHEVFRQKWGHRDCDLSKETALVLGDQWRVEKDWED